MSMTPRKSGKNIGFAMEFGKLLIYLGLALMVAGIVVVLLARTDVHLGRLPGVLFIEEGTRQYIFRW
jgi:hypothetical protein